MGKNFRMKLITAKLVAMALLPTVNLARAPASVSILSYGADASGKNDVSAALSKALSSANHVVVPPGTYLLSGSSTVALANAEIECRGTAASANTPPGYGTTGATFLLTSTLVQPFTVAGGVRIRNCNFFWPAQLGNSELPIVYPPLFTEPSGSQMTNFDLIDVRIVNAYDVVNAANTTDAFGAITLTDTQGYAVHAWFNLANVPETVIIKGMITDTSFYQNVANTGKSYLAKYTARNGTFLHAFGNGNGSTVGSTVSVQGILFSGSVLGYNKFIWVDPTGALAESSFQGIVDAVPRVLEVDPGGCLANVRIDALYYSYEWLGNGEDNAPVFSIADAPASNCSSGGIDIRGQLVQSQGDVIDVTGGGISTISLQLAGNGAFARSTTPGTYFFANIDSDSASFIAIGNLIVPPKVSKDYRGFLIRHCYLCTLAENQFNGIYDPVSISGPTIPVVGSGNISLSSMQGSSIIGEGLYAHRLQLAGNLWDLLAVPSATNCGMKPLIIGNDGSGKLKVGAGVVNSCTLVFAQTYAPATPICLFSANTTTNIAIKKLSPAAVTFKSSGNIGGKVIFYSCQA